MKQTVMLSICGKQTYQDQEPDVIELVTEGSLEKTETGWKILYQESNLTGLEGVTTCFDIADDQMVLTRTGPLKSQMVFQKGITHESLYEMPFGALLLRVCATKIDHTLDQTGGSVDLVYTIEIEQSSAGVIEYHLDIRPVS